MAGGDGRRAGLVGAAAVVAATALVLLLALWAATSGPDDPFRGDGPGVDRPTTSEATAVVAPAPRSGREVDDAPPRGSWLTTVVTVLLVSLALFFVGCLGAVVIALWPERRDRRRRQEAEAAAAPEVVDDPVEAVAVAVVAGAAEQERLLLEGTPRNGIVACWHRFEQQAAGAGVPRHGWETSSEYTLRLLDLVEADASAVAELATLFREARFSQHDLGEADRAVALDALRRIHHDLRTLLSRGVR